MRIKNAGKVIWLSSLIAVGAFLVLWGLYVLVSTFINLEFAEAVRSGLVLSAASIMVGLFIIMSCISSWLKHQSTDRDDKNHNDSNSQ